MTKDFRTVIEDVASILTEQQENENFSKYEKTITIFLARFMWKLRENDLEKTKSALKDLTNLIENGEI